MVGVIPELTAGPGVTWQVPRIAINTAQPVGYQFVVLTGPEPTRYAETAQRIRELRGLARGWDGHDAMPTDPQAIGHALAFLAKLQTAYLGFVRSPIVGAMPDGTVALVWRFHQREVEILFSENGTVEYAVSDRDGVRPPEFREGVDIDQVLSTIVPQHLIV